MRDLPDFAIFITDPEGTVITWNAGVERNLGYTESEFVGQNLSVIFTPEDVANGGPRREMEMAIRHGTFPDRRWHTKKDGTSIFVDGVITALKSESGELTGFAKIMRDVTRRKRMEEALQKSNEELSNFAQLVAHDLGAPLRAISIHLDRALSRLAGPLDDETKASVDFVHKGVRDMQNLIQDLLKLAQISASVEAQPVSLEAALEKALSYFQAVMSATGAAVTHDPLPIVEGNATQFAEIFQNLIGNALKYRSERPPRIHVSVSRYGREWAISVEDNGIGIEAKYLDRIFESFKRLHGGEISGTGLGLTICKKIVERYGGRIWAESQAGKGSKFWFTLQAN
ncbi:MAG TPA: ATP-binding protein [Bryobacteraceae bacterium]|nr:ATP-binding protein [Bryobacteraceae bacterium]